MSDCKVCDTLDVDKPQIFKGTLWCCDRHRKVVLGEVEPTHDEWMTMTPELHQALLKVWS